MESTGQWLEKALLDLRKQVDSGLDLDEDIISGLVSYCELAQPVDAKEYLDNIIGQESGKSVIGEYLRRRGYIDHFGDGFNAPDSKLQPYVKSAAEVSSGGTKKVSRTPKENAVPSNSNKKTSLPLPKSNESNPVVAQGNTSKKKKTGRVISLAEAAKGSIVFQKGKPCVCQARNHKLVSNCLSCGKIVCEQEGEGPCNFCGVLVLKEGSQYAGLEETFMPILSDTEAAAEAYAKRLVDYDRNSAARTTVIDDQSDYYEIEGNSWLSKEEKELLRKKQEQIEVAEQAKRNKVVITFDMVGRKVMLNEDDVSRLESGNGILRPPDDKEINRIKPNPTSRIQPIFINLDPLKKGIKANKTPKKNQGNGLCLEITGRVQHESNELKHDLMDSKMDNRKFSQGLSVSKNSSKPENDDYECSLDYQ